MTTIRTGSNHDIQPVTADSFVFRQSAVNRARRRTRPLGNSTRRGQKRKRPAETTTPGQQERQMTANEEEQEEQSFYEEYHHVLEGLIVYIDKAVRDRQRLTRQALALGARVVDDMQRIVTHIVHGPNVDTNSLKGRHPRLVNHALEHNIRVISPAWLVQCHTQKKRLAELYFPYDVDPQGHIARFQHDSKKESESGSDVAEEEDNPFQLAWDELVSSDDERQTTTTETESQSQRESEATQIQSDEVASLPITAVDEEARLRRKKKRSAEIAILLEKARERQRQKNEHEEEDQSEEDQSLPQSGSSRSQGILPGVEERLDIWYGEQSFYCDSQPATVTPSLPAKPRRPSTRKTMTSLKKASSTTRKQK